MRELNRLVEDLERSESEKYVLTKSGRMRAVVISLDSFARLTHAAAGAAIKVSPQLSTPPLAGKR
jgi:hypothetical protein